MITHLRYRSRRFITRGGIGIAAGVVVTPSDLAFDHAWLAELVADGALEPLPERQRPPQPVALATVRRDRIY